MNVQAAAVLKEHKQTRPPVYNIILCLNFFATRYFHGILDCFYVRISLYIIYINNMHYATLSEKLKFLYQLGDLEKIKS